MLNRIDARGLSCPQPVVLTQKALENIDAPLIEVIVDDRAACENVSRFAQSQGCKVKIKKEGPDFLIEIVRKVGDLSSKRS